MNQEDSLLNAKSNIGIFLSFIDFHFSFSGVKGLEHVQN